MRASADARRRGLRRRHGTSTASSMAGPPATEICHDFDSGNGTPFRTLCCFEPCADRSWARESSTMGLRDYLTADPVRKEKIKSILRRIGYDPTHWLRVVMYRTCFEFVRS